LSVGGSDLETNSVTAGSMQIGTSDNIINNLAGTYLTFPRVVNFDGVDALNNPTAIQGTIVGQMLYLKDVVENLQ